MYGSVVPVPRARAQRDAHSGERSAGVRGLQVQDLRVRVKVRVTVTVRVRVRVRVPP